MKQAIITILFLFCFKALSYATLQIPDILIYNQDTFRLITFPLEKLEIKKKPFKYGKYTYPNTACWRGYRAVWIIKDNILYLKDIRECDNLNNKIDLIEFFRKNKIDIVIKNGLVQANWYSATLFDFNRFISELSGDKSAKSIEIDEINKDNPVDKKFILLEIKKGEIILNKL